MIKKMRFFVKMILNEDPIDFLSWDLTKAPDNMKLMLWRLYKIVCRIEHNVSIQYISRYYDLLKNINRSLDYDIGEVYNILDE